MHLPPNSTKNKKGGGKRTYRKRKMENSRHSSVSSSTI